MDFTRGMCSEDCPIGRKSDGHRFLDFTRCDMNRQSVWAKVSQSSTMPNYCADSTLNCRKKAPFSEEKNALSPWQRTCSHLCRRHVQLDRIGLRTATPSPVFSRFGPVRFLLLCVEGTIRKGAEESCGEHEILRTHTLLIQQVRENYLANQMFFDCLRKKRRLSFSCTNCTNGAHYRNCAFRELSHGHTQIDGVPHLCHKGGYALVSFEIQIFFY